MINIRFLIDIGFAPTQARIFAEPLARTCGYFEINTDRRMGGFLAQCHLESVGFTRLEENLNYLDAGRIMKIFPSSVKSLGQARTLVRNPKLLANTVYANRLGNGPLETGDGWQFRGQGLIQLTGRANYRAASVVDNYEAHPELVREPKHAVFTAGWFWFTNRCNVLADGEDWDRITRKINGPAMLKAKERARLSDKFLKSITRVRHEHNAY